MVLHLDCQDTTIGKPPFQLRDIGGPRCTVEGGLDLGHSCMEIEPCASWVEHSRADLSQDVRKETVGRN